MIKKGSKVVLKRYGDIAWRDHTTKPKLGAEGQVIAIEGSLVPGFVQTEDTMALVKFRGTGSPHAVRPNMVEEV